MLTKMPIRKRWNPKRQNGTRTFTWIFDKTYPPPVGRVREPIPTARTQAQAEAAAREIMDRIHDGSYVKSRSNPVTFSQFVNDVYLPWAREVKLSARMDVYRSKALCEFFEGKQLGEISPFLVESYKLKRLKTPIVIKRKHEGAWIEDRQKPRSPGAVNRELALLSAIFRLAIERKVATGNPVREVDCVPGEDNRERYLLPDEEGPLLSVLTGRRAHLYDMVVLAINTGLRESELLNLDIDSVDFYRDIIILKERRAFTIKNRKGRIIPLNDTSRAVLRRLVDDAVREGRQHLFVNSKTRQTYTSVKTAWATACREAGIKGLRFHDLRHTFATRAVDYGVPLRAVGRVMGHQSTKTTEKYAHATDEAMRRAVEAAQGHRAQIGHKRVEKRSA